MDVSCNTYKTTILDKLNFKWWKIRNRFYRLIICSIGLHKWVTRENTSLVEIKKGIAIKRGNVICNFCLKHLCNYVTDVEIVTPNLAKKEEDLR